MRNPYDLVAHEKALWERVAGRGAPISYEDLADYLVALAAEGGKRGNAAERDLAELVTARQQHREQATLRRLVTARFPWREPTEKEIDKALQMPRDFGYSGELPIGETWALGPVYRTRDSSLLDQSNADALEKSLNSIEAFSEEWEQTSANHWAVGWVDHLSFHAVDIIDGVRMPTPIFGWLCVWFDALEGYPVADDEDYSRRQFEAVFENIAQAGATLVRGNASEEDWVDRVYEWLREEAPDVLSRVEEDPENHSFDEAVIAQALAELNLLDREEAATRELYGLRVRLEPSEDDDAVLVFAEDREAAIEDQSVMGSNWEAPGDMDEAYAIISNQDDLPGALRAEGYIVDDSEWTPPDHGSGGRAK